MNDDDRTCRICKKTFTRPSDLTTHFRSKKHLQAAAMAEAIACLAEARSSNSIVPRRRGADEMEGQSPDNTLANHQTPMNAGWNATVARLRTLNQTRLQQRADLPQDDPYNVDYGDQPSSCITDSEEETDVDENTAIAEEENADMLESESGEGNHADDEEENEREEIAQLNDPLNRFAEKLKPPENKPWHPFASKIEATIYIWCYRRERPLSLAMICEVLNLMSLLGVRGNIHFITTAFEID